MSSKFISGCLIAWLAIRGSIGATFAADAPTSQPAAQVLIDNFTFTPQTLTIAAGTKVTWINHDDIPHTATSSVKPRIFNSGALDTDQQYSFVFTRPGVYPYFCAVHPHMTGQIIVQPTETKNGK
jgi:plastocyanin